MENFAKSSFSFYKKNKSNENQASYKYEDARFSKNEEKKSAKKGVHNKSKGISDAHSHNKLSNSPSGSPSSNPRNNGGNNKGTSRAKDETVSNYFHYSLTNNAEKNYVGKKHGNASEEVSSGIAPLVICEKNSEHMNKNTFTDKIVYFKKLSQVAGGRGNKKENNSNISEIPKDINKNIRHYTKGKFHKMKKGIVSEDNTNNASKDIKIRKSNILELNKLLKENLRIEENRKRKKGKGGDKPGDDEEEWEEDDYEEDSNPNVRYKHNVKSPKMGSNSNSANVGSSTSNASNTNRVKFRKNAKNAKGVKCHRGEDEKGEDVKGEDVKGEDVKGEDVKGEDVKGEDEEGEGDEEEKYYDEERGEGEQKDMLQRGHREEENKRVNDKEEIKKDKEKKEKSKKKIKEKNKDKSKNREKEKEKLSRRNNMRESEMREHAEDSGNAEQVSSSNNNSPERKGGQKAMKKTKNKKREASQSRRNNKMEDVAGSSTICLLEKDMEGRTGKNETILENSFENRYIDNASIFLENSSYYYGSNNMKYISRNKSGIEYYCDNDDNNFVGLISEVKNSSRRKDTRSDVSRVYSFSGGSKPHFGRTFFYGAPQMNNAYCFSDMGNVYGTLGNLFDSNALGKHYDEDTKCIFMSNKNMNCNYVESKNSKDNQITMKSNSGVNRKRSTNSYGKLSGKENLINSSKVDDRPSSNVVLTSSSYGSRKMILNNKMFHTINSKGSFNNMEGGDLNGSPRGSSFFNNYSDISKIGGIFHQGSMLKDDSLFRSRSYNNVLTNMNLLLNCENSNMISSSYGNIRNILHNTNLTNGDNKNFSSSDNNPIENFESLNNVNNLNSTHIMENKTNINSRIMIHNGNNNHVSDVVSNNNVSDVVSSNHVNDVVSNNHVNTSYINNTFIYDTGNILCNGGKVSNPNNFVNPNLELFSAHGMVNFPGPNNDIFGNPNLDIFGNPNLDNFANPSMSIFVDPCMDNLGDPNMDTFINHNLDNYRNPNMGDLFTNFNLENYGSPNGGRNLFTNPNLDNFGTMNGGEDHFVTPKLDNFGTLNGDPFFTPSMDTIPNGYLGNIPMYIINRRMTNRLNCIRNTSSPKTRKKVSNDMQNVSNMLNNILKKNNNLTNVNISNTLDNSKKCNTSVYFPSDAYTQVSSILSNNSKIDPSAFGSNNIKVKKNDKDTFENKQEGNLDSTRKGSSGILTIADKSKVGSPLFPKGRTDKQGEKKEVPMNVAPLAASSVVTPTVVTPTVATPTVATPTVATPSVATPSVATPSVATTRMCLQSESKNDKESSRINPLEKKKKRYLAEIIRCELIWGPTKNKEPITPVESCELHPVVIIKDQFGHLYDDDEDNENNPIGKTVNIFYRWSRGPPRTVCFFHPQKIACLQCTVTFRCFCSYECFMKGFDHLHKYYRSNGSFNIPSHPNLHTYGVPCSPFDWDNYENNIEFDEKHYNSLIQSGLLNSPDKEKWEIINNERNYIPCTKDVGHQIMLETMLLDRNSFSSGESSYDEEEWEEEGDEDEKEKEKEKQKDDHSSDISNLIDKDNLQNSLNNIVCVKYEDVQKNEVQFCTISGKSCGKGEGCRRDDDTVNLGESPNIVKMSKSNTNYVNAGCVESGSNSNGKKLNGPPDISDTHYVSQGGDSVNIPCDEIVSSNVICFPESNNFRCSTNNMEQMDEKREDSFNTSCVNVSLGSMVMDTSGNNSNINTLTIDNNRNASCLNLSEESKNKDVDYSTDVNPVLLSPQKQFNEFIMPNNDLNISPDSMLQPPPLCTNLETSVNMQNVSDLGNVVNGNVVQSPNGEMGQKALAEGNYMEEVSIGSKAVISFGHPTEDIPDSRENANGQEREVGCEEGACEEENVVGNIEKSSNSPNFVDLSNITYPVEDKYLQKGKKKKKKMQPQAESPTQTQLQPQEQSQTKRKKKKKKKKKKVYVLDDHVWNSVRDPNIYHKIVTGCCIPNLTILPNYNITCFKNANLTNPHNQFTIMTWNVLAEIYGTIEAFPHCDPYMLAWSYRKSKIIQEILNNNPDIVCLQEIQNEHFLDFFKPSLSEFGYEGVYKQKTKEIFTSPSGKRRGGKYTIDGCAIFYKKKKLKFVETYALEFSKLIKEASVLTLPKEIQKNPSLVKRLLKDNVALVLLLEYIQQYSKIYDEKEEEKKKKKMIIIANTHIVANPEANYVKIWQAQILVKVIEHLKINFINKYETIPSLIICGDFNSTPSSAVYQLIYKKTCSRNHEDFNTDKYSLLTDLPLGHNLNLKSAYAISKMLAQKLNPDEYTHLEIFEPLFTNYTGNFIGCLDYIFYNDENLNIISTVNIADENQLMQEAQMYQLSNCALPSPIRPSDHLPLIAKFEFKMF
ncbi:carbon catabolite repressor protein 4, putative [Plasmodium ovale]|uniref:Carbon catabolite repressor protein 4, putative n=1 Tax=Plasmodium ovale TaxID=36330 RepID=A0A1D3U8L3_PLAOA|nr:carbon catabolite repressor protein 4, putative [Plasmodium ovale]